MVEKNLQNVIYLNKLAKMASSQLDPELPQEAPPQALPDMAFQAVIIKNRENILRMQRDRSKTNQAVLKSYRLK